MSIQFAIVDSGICMLYIITIEAKISNKCMYVYSRDKRCMCLLEQEYTGIEQELTLGLKIWRFKMTEMMIDRDPSKLHNNNYD